MMPAFMIKLAASLVGERFARPLAWLIIVTIAIAALACGKTIYDRSVIRQHDSELTAEVSKRNSAALDASADQRAVDQIRINTEERERYEAINSAPNGKPSTAAIALGCERLRKSGQDTSRFTECSGSDRRD